MVLDYSLMKVVDSGAFTGLFEGLWKEVKSKVAEIVPSITKIAIAKDIIFLRFI